MLIDGFFEFVQKFPDEKSCREYYEKIRWSKGVSCVHCKCEKIYTYKDGRYKCSDCKRQFRLTTGTIFEHSNISLRKWFLAYYLLSSSSKGISSVQLARQLKITQKSAWYMLHKIRYANVQSMYKKLDGIVECDETYIGGKRKFSKRGRGAAHKTPVFGILQRNGLLRIWPVENVKGKTLKGLIEENVKPGSTVMTDEFRSYNGLSKKYYHKVVEHGAFEYVSGDAHVNGLEGAWSLFKRSIRGIYHCPSKKHLEKYCAEFQFRYNTRKMGTDLRFRTALRKAKKSVKHRDIIS